MIAFRSLLFSVLAFSAGAALAADHRDGPLATSDPSADINDVYTFVNPVNPAELVTVVTLHPVASLATRFSDAVEYQIHFDNGAQGGASTVSCRFADGGNSVNCSGPRGLAASGRIEQIVNGNQMRVFAGVREDPFFFDLEAFNMTVMAVAPRFRNPGVDFFAPLNTMSITLGIQSSVLTQGASNSVLRVYASTRRAQAVGVSPGHSGQWIETDKPGHGVYIHTLDPSTGVANGPRRMTVMWATYNAAGQQIWLYGAGDISGNTASIPVQITTGGRFPPDFNPNQVQTQSFGTLNFTFDSCSRATMRVTTSLFGFTSSTVPLSRLTTVESLPCAQFVAGQIDRMGRPAINTALIDLLTSTGKKNAYNQAETLTQWLTFTSEIQGNLTALDTLDGTTGNTLLPPAALAPVLADDRLLIDASVPLCDSYLAVEVGVTSQCGGRTLRRDVIDDTLGAVVGPGVSDNVAFSATLLADFPFIGIPR